MIEKWKQRAIHMNFKKAVIIFLITCLVLMISVPAVLYGNFQNRITEWEQVEEKGREHREREKFTQEGEKLSREDDEKDLEEIHRYFRLSWGDFALLAGCVVIETVLGIWYWILVMLWAYRKAYRMGINGGLALLAALFFNIAAVGALYLYGFLKGTCAICGRVRSGNGRFCGRCGSPLKRECPQCGQETDASSAYCSNCGQKLQEDQETEK